MMPRKVNRYRLGEKWVRLAYEAERDAARLRESGFSGEAEHMQDVGRAIGKIGRRLRDGGY